MKKNQRKIEICQLTKNVIEIDVYDKSGKYYTGLDIKGRLKNPQKTYQCECNFTELIKFLKSIVRTKIGDLSKEYAWLWRREISND